MAGKTGECGTFSHGLQQPEVTFSLGSTPEAFTEVSSVRAQRVEVAAGPLECSCLGGWTAAVVDVGVDWLEDHRVCGRKS